MATTRTVTKPPKWPTVAQRMKEIWLPWLAEDPVRAEPDFGDNVD